MRRQFAIATMTALMACAQPTVGMAVEDFFRGKQIRMVLPTAPGGSTSLYGMTLGEFMARHIPGNPMIVPEYRPGAGGVVAASYVYNAAPKDGTVITMLLSSMLTIQLLQPRQRQVRHRELHAYRPHRRSAARADRLARVGPQHHRRRQDARGGARRLRQGRQHGDPSGADERAHRHAVQDRHRLSRRRRHLSRARARRDRGHHRGVGRARLERGDWLKNGLVKVLVRMGYRKIAGFKSVPTLTDARQVGEDKAVLELALARIGDRAGGVGAARPAGRPAHGAAACLRPDDEGPGLPCLREEAGDAGRADDGRRVAAADRAGSQHADGRWCYG